MLRQPRETGLLSRQREGKLQCKTNPRSKKNSFRPSTKGWRGRLSSILIRIPDSYQTNKLARDALNMVNRALVNNKDVLSPPFLCSRFSRNNNLVFTTGFNHNNMDCDAYLSIICNVLASIGPATADINEQWSKFLIHGVPTYTTMTEIRNRQNVV
jgi:hypothetical protein